MHLFAEHGRPMSAQEYFDQLAGLSDPEIVKTWLGEDHPDVEAVIGGRGRRDREAAPRGGARAPDRRGGGGGGAPRGPPGGCPRARRGGGRPGGATRRGAR